MLNCHEINILGIILFFFFFGGLSKTWTCFCVIHPYIYTFYWNTKKSCTYCEKPSDQEHLQGSPNIYLHSIFCFEKIIRTLNKQKSVCFWDMIFYILQSHERSIFSLFHPDQARERDPHSFFYILKSPHVQLSSLSRTLIQWLSVQGNFLNLF